MKQEFGLIVDWETSGLLEDRVPTRTFLEGPQGIEIGAILVRLPEFNPVAEFQSKVRFLGMDQGISYGGPIHQALTWSTDAERVHGVKIADTRNSPIPSHVADSLIEFIKTHTRYDDLNTNRIMLCGHNPSFDAYFTRQLLFLGGKERSIRMHHRMIDTFSLGYVMYGIKSSNELFKKISSTSREIHTAIADARLTLEALRHMYNSCRDLNINDR